MSLAAILAVVCLVTAGLAALHRVYASSTSNPGYRFTWPVLAVVSVGLGVAAMVALSAALV